MTQQLPDDFDVVAHDLHKLEREIATEAAIFEIETKALLVAVCEGPISVYDVSKLEPTRIRDSEILEADQRSVQRAASYLDLRGLLRRSDPKRPNLVSIGSAA